MTTWLNQRAKNALFWLTLAGIIVSAGGAYGFLLAQVLSAKDKIEVVEERTNIISARLDRLIDLHIRGDNDKPIHWQEEGTQQGAAK